MKWKFFQLWGLFLIMVATISCTDQTSSGLFTFLENNSGHNITLNFYKDGKIFAGLSQEDYVYFNTSLTDQEIKKVDTSGDSGKLAGSGYVRRISSMDSAIVVFDGIKKSVHYPQDRPGTNLSGIKFSEARNLFNLANYQERIVVDNDKRFEAEYKYTFTEQDYLNAN